MPPLFTKNKIRKSLVQKESVKMKANIRTNEQKQRQYPQSIIRKCRN